MAHSMDLPVGSPVSSTDPAQRPPRTPLHGQYTSVIPLRPDHWRSLYKHLGGPENFWRWTYMLTGGFKDEEECKNSIRDWSLSQDPVYYVVLSGPESDAASEPVGLLGYLAIVPQHRRIEIGCVILGEAIRNSRQATEGFYLFIKHAFDDLGNYRVEWKANHLNERSLSAARRLGFTFEGIFRKHMIVKGRRRDTAWFSITNDEWPRVQHGFEAWLDEGNFDEHGKQQRGLKEFRDGTVV